MQEIDEEYENTIKNIDLQLERLSNGLVQPEKKEEYKFIEKKKTTENEKVEVAQEDVEQEVINQEIRDELERIFNRTIKNNKFRCGRIFYNLCRI